jgi:hypothetical protein
MDLIQKKIFIFQFEDVPGGFVPRHYGIPYCDTTELPSPMK